MRISSAMRRAKSFHGRSVIENKEDDDRICAVDPCRHVVCGDFKRGPDTSSANDPRRSTPSRANVAVKEKQTICIYVCIYTFVLYIGFNINYIQNKSLETAL